jgi:CBS domain containing-hemolysin-like protein
MRHLNLQLAGAQLGITMASLLLGFVAEPAVAGLIEDAATTFVDLPERLVHTIGFVVALTIVAFLHMVIGEMVPKNVAIADPERTLLALALPNRAYVTVFGPVLRVLNGLSNAGVRLFGVEPRDDLATAASADELALMLGASRDEGLIAEVAHQLLTGALDLGDRSITTVMVPRDGVVWLPRTATPADAEELVLSSGHTRLLVAGGDDVDDLLGFIHAKDLLTLSGDARRRPLPLGRVRRMLVLASRTSLDDALLAMQQARVHVAVVADGGGHTLGIATLEDVIEALVGDIRDESDR